MEIVSALLALCVGNSPVSGEFPAQRPGQWRGALIFSLICAWIKGWVNNRETGDLRRHRAHYDVTVKWSWRKWLQRTDTKPPQNITWYNFVFGEVLRCITWFLHLIVLFRSRTRTSLHVYKGECCSILNKKKRASISTGNSITVKTAQVNCLVWVKSAMCHESSFA